jgi:hypothetical protein
MLLAGFTYTRRSVKGADKRTEERGRVVKGAARTTANEEEER